ncbi:MAG: FAD-dependent oxidoreductase [Firmicutes bacterium]|nr:FAD-dependent oxidoreductase [Bacillota bacterium]
MNKIVVIGGGWSGIAASITAKNAGAEVTLLEKTDMILGLGNVGGIMRNNGRYTAAEENIALGVDEIFALTDKLSRHVNVDFPGHKHASLYDVLKMEPAVRRLLKEKGIEILTLARATDVAFDDVSSSTTVPGTAPTLKSIRLADGRLIEGDVFVECTGSTGPMGNCQAYGNGCSMCVLRCPAFGPRVSISQKAGVGDIRGRRKDGTFGAFSGSGKLAKESLSEELQEKLNTTGVAVIPLPKELITAEKLDIKVCQQYALEDFAENIVLLDTGHAKIMTPFMPLEKLRQVPGLEEARYVDPYAGGKGNSIRYLSTAPRDNAMKVKGVENLFCGGEKSGLFVGHTEAISTGSLAGHNAARLLAGKEPLELPKETAIGDLVSYANEELAKEGGVFHRYTFAGAEFFARMKERGLYSTDRREISDRVKKCGLTNVYRERMM